MTVKNALWDAAHPPLKTDNGRLIRGFHLVNGRQWARSQQTSDGGYESIFVAFRGDTSRVHLRADGYSFDCGWCYLGAGHSRNLHNSESLDAIADEHCQWCGLPGIHTTSTACREAKHKGEVAIATGAVKA